MTLEEQFNEALKEREEQRKRSVKETTLYFAQAEERVAPCADILSVREQTDEETWSPEARAVFAYAMSHSDLSTSKESYKTLFHLVEAIESTEEIGRVGYQVLWMTSFCLLADDDKEVDFLIDRAEKCDQCRETHILYTAQYLVMDRPMCPNAIAGIVHNGYGPEFWGLIWCDLEGLADGMYWSEEPQDSPWRQLCRETSAENVTGMLDYVKGLKERVSGGKTKENAPSLTQSCCREETSFLLKNKGYS